MFMVLAACLVVLFYCSATPDILTKFYSNASCFSLLWLYMANNQVSVYRTIGPLVFKKIIDHFYHKDVHKENMTTIHSLTSFKLLCQLGFKRFIM